VGEGLGVTEPRTITDLQEAVSLLEFVDIIVYESRGQRRDGGFDDLLEDSTNGQGNGELRMDLLVQDGPEGLAIRAQCVTSSRDVVVSYDAAALYRKAEPMVLDAATASAFIGSSALMTLYPFLREGVHEVSARLGFPIKLGLLKRGETGVQLNDVQPSINEVNDVLASHE
jgi:hypothetical protein